MFLRHFNFTRGREPWKREEVLVPSFLHRGGRRVRGVHVFPSFLKRGGDPCFYVILTNGRGLREREEVHVFTSFLDLLS